jgi:hypothetical protein
MLDRQQRHGTHAALTMTRSGAQRIAFSSWMRWSTTISRRNHKTFTLIDQMAEHWWHRSVGKLPHPICRIRCAHRIFVSGSQRALHRTRDVTCLYSRRLRRSRFLCDRTCAPACVCVCCRMVSVVMPVACHFKSALISLHSVAYSAATIFCTASETSPHQFDP